MLIEFSVTNFRSIKDKVTFTMLPSGKIKESDHEENLFSEDKYNLKLLKSSLIYGGNASGKSNFLWAFQAITYLVGKSIDFKLDEEIGPYEPFKLDQESNNFPVEFTIDFITRRNNRYIYTIRFNSKEFLHESLYFFPEKHKNKLFKRENSEISYGDYFKGLRKFKLLPNQLLLSKAGKEPIEPLKEPYRFFDEHIFCNIYDNISWDDAVISTYTELMVKEKDSFFRDNMNKLLCASDSGIKSLNIKKLDEKQIKLPEYISDEEKKDIINRLKFRIKTEHGVFSERKQIRTELFDLSEESAGTQKLLVIGNLMLDALRDGTTIIIDELDKSLHPLLTRMLINLFNSNQNNPNNAQLIFATHDITLIDQDLLRRDQIWLTEKDIYGGTELYPLSDYTGISKVRKLNDWYMTGRFGGVPKLKDFVLNFNINHEKNEKKIN